MSETEMGELKISAEAKAKASSIGLQIQQHETVETIVALTILLEQVLVANLGQIVYDELKKQNRFEVRAFSVHDALSTLLEHAMQSFKSSMEEQGEDAPDAAAATDVQVKVSVSAGPPPEATDEKTVNERAPVIPPEDHRPATETPAEAG